MFCFTPAMNIWDTSILILTYREWTHTSLSVSCPELFRTCCQFANQSNIKWKICENLSFWTKFSSLHRVDKRTFLMDKSIGEVRDWCQWWSAVCTFQGSGHWGSFTLILFCWSLLCAQGRCHSLSSNATTYRYSRQLCTSAFVVTVWWRPTVCMGVMVRSPQIFSHIV